MSEYQESTMSPEELLEDIHQAADRYTSELETSSAYDSVEEELGILAEQGRRASRKTLEIISQNLEAWLEKRHKTIEAFKEVETLIRLYQRRFPKSFQASEDPYLRILEEPIHRRITYLSAFYKILTQNFTQGIIDGTNSTE